MITSLIIGLLVLETQLHGFQPLWTLYNLVLLSNILVSPSKFVFLLFPCGSGALRDSNRKISFYSTRISLLLVILLWWIRFFIPHIYTIFLFGSLKGDIFANYKRCYIHSFWKSMVEDKVFPWSLGMFVLCLRMRVAMVWLILQLRVVSWSLSWWLYV